MINRAIIVFNRAKMVWARGRNRGWTWGWAGVLGTLFLFSAPGISSAGEPPAQTIIVTGSGTALGRPDQVEIDAAVVSTGKGAKDTVDANSRTMAKVLADLRDAGLGDGAVATTHYDVSPRFQKQTERSEAPIIVGYRVSSRIRVTVSDLNKVGEVLDQMAAAGINKISGLRFVLTKRDDLTDRALRAAMANARHKAEIVAAAAGVGLGPVVKVEERGTSLPRARLMAFSERDTVPIVPGGQTVRGSVSVTYALIPKPTD